MHQYYYGSQNPPPRRRPVRRGRRGKAVFALFLLLIAAGIGAWVILYGWGGRGNAPAELPPELSAQPTTTLERAPVGDGTVMNITLPPEGDGLPPQEIYKKNIPSIVCITATGQRRSTQGTGIVLTEDGYIITNAHVIAGSARVELETVDERRYEALLVGWDVETDLAVLKVDAHGLVPAEFGDSDFLEVGEPALAIGNPLGAQLKGTMTDGIISAINRDVDVDGRVMTLLQTTAALNAGNSGGALINRHGQVVGVTTLKMAFGGLFIPAESLGFAIPTQAVKLSVDALIAFGEIEGGGVLGISVYTVKGGDDPGGAYVSWVNARADAWAQGLRPRDVITRADSRRVTGEGELRAALRVKNPGETVLLQVWRGGTFREIEVRLMEQGELG